MNDKERIKTLENTTKNLEIYIEVLEEELEVAYESLEWSDIQMLLYSKPFKTSKVSSKSLASMDFVK